MVIRAVFFDVGETLIDETRPWEEWADWLGVPRLTLFGVLGGVIERGEPHTRAFDLVRPGVDLEKERAARATHGVTDRMLARDLYPDAVDCLKALRAGGYIVGVAGNASARHEQQLAAMSLPVDVITSSEALGADKPAPEFFHGISEITRLDPAEVAYVGDRLDNDVLPAISIGMVGVFVRRGPWGYLHSTRPELDQADVLIDSLDELPQALQRWRR